MIIGARFGSVDFEPRLDRNSANQPLVEYKYRDHGGVEQVTLTEAQMPSHRHTMSYQRTSGIGREHGLAAAGQAGTDNKKSSPAGSDRPHANMPPYIALYFCKKD